MKFPKIKKLKRRAKKPDFSKLKEFDFNTFLAALSYFHLLVIFPIIFSRRSKFVKHHSKQGIVLLAVWTIVLFSFYLPVLPYLLLLFLFAEMIYGITNVFLKNEKSLFWVGAITKKI